MKRWSFFVYGVGCHLLFLATYAYMAGFVGNFLIPRTIDSNPADLLAAAGIDLPRPFPALFEGLSRQSSARPSAQCLRLAPEPPRPRFRPRRPTAAHRSRVSRRPLRKIPQAG